MTHAAETLRDTVAGSSTERWKHGHQIFHLYLVAMNTVLDDSQAALEASEPASLTASLRDLARLYDAATSCMKYAADFAAEDYENHVRPTMMPPSVKPGFSGLLNRDHAAMLTQLRRLRLQIPVATATSHADGAEAVTAAWDAVRAAQRRNRAHHMLVCRKFVSDGVSLLREFYANQRVSTEEE